MSSEALTPAGARRRGTTARTQRRTGWLLVAPFTILMIVFVLIPVIWAARLSLYTGTLARGPVFTGLGNFVSVFKDSQFGASVLRILTLGIVQVPVTLAIALFAALLLDHFTGWYPKLFRISLFLPYAIPGVVAVLMWSYLYSPTFGPLRTNLLTQHTGLLSVGNVIFWGSTGFNMIILYSSLQGVPQELYQAARVDGAGHIRLALSIKIPIIAPSLVLSALLAILATMQLFTEPNILSEQAPDVFVQSYTPNTYAYNLAFSYSQFNYAAAVSFSVAIIVSIISFILLTLTRKRSGLV